MKLTAFYDYSVRVLLYVTINNDRLVSIKEVSKALVISQNHLMKIVHVLGKGGYLKTLRGKNGGFKLGMGPDEINLGSLIRYTEDDLSIVECHGSSCVKCLLLPGCQLRIAIGGIIFIKIIIVCFIHFPLR